VAVDPAAHAARLERQRSEAAAEAERAAAAAVREYERRTKKGLACPPAALQVLPTDDAETRRTRLGVAAVASQFSQIKAPYHSDGSERSPSFRTATLTDMPR
jgi:hypothetical protein